MPTVLEAVATANPPLRRSQASASEFMGRVESLPERVRARIPALYERSAIGYRYSCVEDYGREPADFEFYPTNWLLDPAPSTADRNAKYRKEVLPLAERAAREALEAANLRPSDITHVIAVSCTGFFAPGIDIELVKRLGLPPSTRRAVIGFMGCYAALNGLRVAHGFCASSPNARVLLVCAELCTLHFQVSDSFEQAVVNALFSDGAAAAILSAKPESEAAGCLAYVDELCVLDDDSMDHMTWDIGDTGFNMGLSSRVPAVLRKHLPDFVDTITRRNEIKQDDLDFWAIHPGGRMILDHAQEVLGLDEADLDDSLTVLHDYGNMSSPTILFVLKRVLERHHRLREEGNGGLGAGVAMAFGPGLTLEGCLFRQI